MKNASPLCRRSFESLETQAVTKAQKKRLEALYQISAFLAKSSSLQEMSHGFAYQVRVLMKADALAVRWSGEDNQKSHILSSANFPLEMQEKESCLLANACACGSFEPDLRIRVIPIKNTEIAPLQYCSKYGYETLVSVPVKLKSKVLGEIDLFYRYEKNLTAEELELVDTFASHLASAVDGMKTIALEKEAAVAKERSMLARELHDSVAQSLAFLKIQSRLLRSSIAKKDGAATAKTMDELDHGLQESMADVRELLLHFRTRTSDDEIEAAVQETLQKFHHQTNLSVSWKVTGEGLPLPQDVQTHVLHVLQESLSNVRKHAAATHVSIAITKGDSWRFEVCDDGVGFDFEEAKRSQLQVGLKIMQERAAQIGAQVELHSKVGEGTSVILHVPSVQSMTTEPLRQESGDVLT